MRAQLDARHVLRPHGAASEKNENGDKTYVIAHGGLRHVAQPCAARHSMPWRHAARPGVLWAEAHHLIMHYAFTMRGRREDGLALSRPLASAVIATFIIICLLVLPQPTSRRSGADQQLKRDDA
ncbi:MAG TPA: hypothetical protein VGG01_13785 [Xanthobacteraceae bacterium]|jgi:hypothetical protein